MEDASPHNFVAFAEKWPYSPIQSRTMDIAGSFCCLANWNSCCMRGWSGIIELPGCSTAQMQLRLYASNTRRQNLTTHKFPRRTNSTELSPRTLACKKCSRLTCVYKRRSWHALAWVRRLLPVTSSMFPSKSTRNCCTAHHPTTVLLGAAASPANHKLATPTRALDKRRSHFHVVCSWATKYAA